ncbi:MAG: signal peptidase I [Chloroflexota bacterium]
MKQSRRWQSIFLDLILLLGLVVLWVVFAPARIGGQASYVMVNGVSMEPGYHSGDLVIVRRARAYQVGDVVTYCDAEMGAYVIHRIIGIEQGQIVLKGDNNSWIDAYHPAQDEIIGKQWIHVPKMGWAMQWLRTPLNLSLSIVLLGGVLMTGTIPKSPQGRTGKNSPSFNPGGILEGTLYLLGFLCLAFLGLSIFAFTRPLTRVADGISYQQESNYFYSATGAPGVYDAEMVRTGEPVFPKLTCFLNVGFTYNMLGGPFQNVAGNYQMYARVADEQSGWQRTIPMLPQTSFAGNSVVAMAPLDLCQLEALVDLVESETGLRANTYTVEIVTDIAVVASTAGQVFQDRFDPALVFKFDKVHLYLADHDAGSDPMHITKQGLAASSMVVANTLPVLGWEPTVGAVRALALIGLGLSLGGVALMGFILWKTARQGEEASIRLRYGSMIMDVLERSLDPSLPVIDVTSMDDLAKMAERQNTMILHMTLNFLHFYLVQGNGAMYRYILSAGKRGVPEVEPARGEVFGYLADSQGYTIESPQAIQWDGRGYLLEMGNDDSISVSPRETEVLRRIRV